MRERIYSYKVKEKLLVRNVLQKRLRLSKKGKDKKKRSQKYATITTGKAVRLESKKDLLILES